MKIHKAKIFLVLLGILLLFGSFCYAEEKDQGELRRLKRMELYVYGKVQDGGIADRLSQLHKDLLGRDIAQSNPEKLESLFKFLFKGSSSAPSVDMKVNFLEWKIFHENRQGKLADRLDSLEKIVLGKPSNDALAFRLEHLIQMSVESGIILLHSVKIPKGTEFRVRLDRTLSSKKSKAGDEFQVHVTDDLILEKNVLAVGKGGYAAGEIDQVKKAGRFGKPGKLKILINEISAIDGTPIPVVPANQTENIDKKKLGLALGASAVGYIALGGPVGLIGGIFVKGKEGEFPAGSEFIVISIEDVYVNGVVINRN